MPQLEAPEPQNLPPTHKPDYSRLTRSDLGLLLKLRRDGLTQTEIAQRLGCNQSTVHKWLAEFEDTTADSKAYLRGKALTLAQNIVKKGRAADHVSVLKGLGVLEEQQQTGITVKVEGFAFFGIQPGSQGQVQSARGQYLEGETVQPSAEAD